MIKNVEQWIVILEVDYVIRLTRGAKQFNWPAFSAACYPFRTVLMVNLPCIYNAAFRGRFFIACVVFTGHNANPSLKPG